MKAALTLGAVALSAIGLANPAKQVVQRAQARVAVRCRVVEKGKLFFDDKVVCGDANSQPPSLPVKRLPIRDGVFKTKCIDKGLLQYEMEVEMADNAMVCKGSHCGVVARIEGKFEIATRPKLSSTTDGTLSPKAPLSLGSKWKGLTPLSVEFTGKAWMQDAVVPMDVKISTSIDRSSCYQSSLLGS